MGGTYKDETSLPTREWNAQGLEAEQQHLETKYQTTLKKSNRNQFITRINDAVLLFVIASGIIGWVYWGYLTWTLGSWFMAVLLLLFPIGAILGFISLVFGTPEWVYFVFS